jgi:mannose-6-phosphate isomerase-like protein (cupin superfamily)
MANTTRSTATLHTPGAELHRVLERLRHPFAHAAAEELTIEPDDARSVHVGHEPMAFTVLEGELLVTCEGDLEDHVVGAGETFVTERRGHHVLAAFRPSKVRLAEVTAPARRAA